jgi:hypothetical protein
MFPSFCVALLRRESAGLNVPRIQWHHYAANSLASLRRESGGLIVPRIKWLYMAAK